MKIREGFVSNSSSTSYICRVCGETTICSDCGSLEDIGYLECTNGHIFCAEHLVKAEEFKEKDDDEDEEYDEEEYFDRRSMVSEKTCPICTASALDSDLVLPFLLKKLGWKKSEIWEEMQKLGTYENMLMYCSK
jgi:hypothetical protein